MNVIWIRKALTIFCILFIVVGGIFVMYQKYNKISVSKEEIEENNLRTYIGHRKEEIEQLVGKTMITLEMGGVTVATFDSNYHAFFFLEEERIKAILVQENEGKQSVEGIKIGQTLQGQKDRLEQEYSYKSYLLQGEKFDLYDKKDGDYLLGFAIKEETNQIYMIFVCSKDYEDTFLKWGFGQRSEKK